MDQPVSLIMYLVILDLIESIQIKLYFFHYKQMTLKSFNVVDYYLKGANTKLYSSTRLQYSDT